MSLMSYEEYKKHSFQWPYIYRIKGKDTTLYYFGERHSYNPDDEQWKKLKEFWSEFIQKTKGKQRIVFVEGGKRPVEDNEEKAIYKNGGGGLITYLASQVGIDTHSPEPADKDERHALEKQFSREEIQYYYFARAVYQWGRTLDPKPEFKQYIVGFLKDDEKESGWKNFDFSLNSMKHIHKKLFGTDFNEHDPDFFYDISNPIDEKTIINSVARASSEVRDNYIVNEVKKYWQNGYSIFIHYGFGHAVIQEPALHELVK